VVKSEAAAHVIISEQMKHGSIEPFLVISVGVSCGYSNGQFEEICVIWPT
jgi:hypothetical protein